MLRRALPLVFLLLAAAPSPALAGDVLVFAAASLKTALDRVAAGFEDETGHHATISYAGSSQLARQIQLGAPADMFLSANTGWMDVLDKGGLIAPGTRHDLLGNSLVLIAAGGGAAPLPLGSLPQVLGTGRLAMAQVDAVPVGIYAKAALRQLGLWPALAPRVAQTGNARAALALVATGEAPFGVVYATDAHAEPRVSVVARFPADSHPPITYPVALIAGHETDAARALLWFLGSDAARAAFTGEGFTMIGAPG